MTDDAYRWYKRYEPWRRYAEVAFWIAFFGLNAGFNSVTRWMEIQRRGLGFDPWEPAVWEATSAVGLLLLVPWLVWLTRRHPPTRRPWRRTLAIYLLASLIYSLLHVLVMVLLRSGAYALMGDGYSFGPWPRQLFYEYMKDVRAFLGSILIIEVYRFALRRLQGEARMLDPADDEPPAAYPERFLVRMVGREFLLAADRVEWAQAAGNYVNLRVGDRDYPLRSTLSGLASKLDPTRFVQTHRSWIVNLDRVREIQPLDSGDARIRMLDGTTIPCSRRFRDRLRERLTT